MRAEFTNIIEDAPATAEFANASDRSAAVRELVRAEMQRNGGDYTRAFASVQSSNPALFDAMKSPRLMS